MRQLFVHLVRRVTEKEDVFTECLAAALREDRNLARRFVAKLCAGQPTLIDGHPATIDVVTQRSFSRQADVPACCVDMLISIDGTVNIGVENKLFSDEGRDERGDRDQLKNYLRLGLDGLAYIRAQEASVADPVRHDRQYLAPPYRHHFLWSDFYTDIDECARQGAILTISLRELFRYYGFDPPKSEIGDLTHPDKAIAEANRRNFAKLWESLAES